MNRTRRWEFVKQDAIRLAALGLSDTEIGKRLDVDRATVYRWRKAGKFQSERPTLPSQPVVLSATEQTPAQWAASVRMTFALDVTDQQLVSQAEAALLVTRDPQASASLRFQAAREFRATVKQLSLVTRPEVGDLPAEPPKREAVKAGRRVDPRTLAFPVAQ